MDHAKRLQIIELSQGGASQRQIARELHVSRRTVRQVLAQVQAQRASGCDELPDPPRKGVSMLDKHHETIEALLARYPNLSAVRVLEELRADGFKGSYTIVREKVRELRPTPTRQPVVRFESGPGVQAQMDYATYTIDFAAEGRQRVHLFGYILGYSRRQYLQFVERQDFDTTVRCHIRAFEYLGGVAATCLYDNMKVVVSGYDGGQPIYNPRFLAFAVHYGFRPWACRPRRPQTKGKIERPFSYVESSLLAGRVFQSLEHLNDVTRWWQDNVADVRTHRTTNQRPIDRHAEERPFLIPLPARPYDPSPVVYRVVDAESMVGWRNNHYWVPWRYIGQMLPVRITETELLVYSPRIEEIARHPLFGPEQSGERTPPLQPPPRRDSPERLQELRERYLNLGEAASRFLEGLLQARRRGKSEAWKVLALLGTYRDTDLTRALERAVRFRAFSLRAVERILAVNAKPKSLLDALADDVRQRLDQFHAEPPITPRSTAEYQSLLEPDNESQPLLDGVGQIELRTELNNGCASQIEPEQAPRASEQTGSQPQPQESDQPEDAEQQATDSSDPASQQGGQAAGDG